MTWSNWIWVFLGGGIGASLRWLMSHGVLLLRSHSIFPWATFLSNALSCILLAWGLHYSDQHPGLEWLKPFLFVGICGGFSTFSTFSFESIHLLKQGYHAVFAANVLMNLGLCFFILLVWYKK